ncbi:MAG: Holliday junction branch migration protein RuvA [Atopobiaceae bacterium]|nr:Holliday junction branch migration protein RuvA [Atopobiaceae bacterium]MBR3314073.1 Holliday junction branch migration protein RuvA [Atopobiaceae bacterium]
MIVSLTGTLAEVLPSTVVLDVQGVGYEMGVSSTTAAALPPVGSEDVTLLTRLVVREGAIDLYGFGSRAERALFDRLVQISGVGPKLALSVLSTFTPQALAGVVADQNATRMAKVPGVGKKTASRLLIELADVFTKDAVLSTLAPETSESAAGGAVGETTGVDADALAAMLAMGFTQQEAQLALEGHREAGARTTEAALGYALKRIGGGR